ncbi:MAG TPA: plastocyanin/azurin family copper-binding protein [Ktedonobacteraceae bacterium]|nr:plastocyanin/azurin family copper-binding protein [Ktedonobacteraceae bacterium]
MKTYLKSILFSLIALSALVLLAACGGGSTSTSSATTPTAAATATTPATPTAGTTSTPATNVTPSGNTKTVMIITDSSGSFAFSPATLTIKAGTTVIWKNTTAVAHTVTSDDGQSFDSGTSTPIAAQTGTFSFTFTTPGTFAYHCEIHPFMKATIIVQ